MIEKPEQSNQINDMRVSGKVFSTISLVTLILVLAVSFILFAREIIMSLKFFNPAQGILSSPWVGFKNFRELFSSFTFFKTIQNTLIFNLLFAGMLFVVSTLLGYVVMALPKRGKEILAVFCALLVFLPVDVFSSWLIHLLGSEILINAGVMRFFHPFLCTIKYLGIPIMVIYIRDQIYIDRDSLTPVKVAGLFSLASLAFISNGFFSMTNALYNPLTYQTMDTLDIFKFRKGLLQTEVGISSSVGVAQTLISILCVAVLIMPIWFLFKSVFRGERKASNGDTIVSKLISSLIAFIIFAVIYFLPYILKGRSFDAGQLGGSINLGYPIVTYIAISIVSAVFATILAAMMSGAFVSTNKSVRIVAGAMLMLITILSINPVRMSDYLLVRDLGLMNTVFAIILTTSFSAVAVWAMISILRNDQRLTVRSISIAMLGLFLIQTAIIYGNSIPQMIYINTMPKFPLMIFQEIHISMQSIISSVTARASAYGVIGLYGFIIALPPLLLFLLANIFLPKDKLLAIICAGTKNW